MSLIKRRRQSRHTEDNPERWLVSYADFITLLFAFFTVLFATSQRDVEKSKQFEFSIKKYLVKLTGGGGEMPAVNQETRHTSPIEAPIPTFEPANSSTEKMRTLVETFIESNLSRSQIDDLIYDINSNSLGVRISIKADAVFPTNSAKFKPEVLPFLKTLGGLLEQTNQRVIVEGHTDDRSVKTSRYTSNWELASVRATSLVRYLNKIHHIPETKLAAMSYGPARPAVPNSDQQSRQRNRRMDFVVITDDVNL